jgi:hypothetical protein
LVPIRDSIGEALRFTRENWRFVLMVAGAGALAHTLALVVLGGIAPLWLVGLVLISAAIYAALTRAALSGVAAVRAELARDTGRTAASGGIVGFFFAIVAFVIVYVAMSVLIAPYSEEAKALVDDQAALAALMERAVGEQPNTVLAAMVIGFVVLLLLTSRLYLAVPASVERGRILVFESWRWTRGAVLRIAAARIALLGPALIFAGALQSLVGMAIGVGAGDPIALAQRAQSNPAGFLVFYAAAQFVQITVYTSLEAGLSAALYKGLKPEAAGAGA